MAFNLFRLELLRGFVAQLAHQARLALRQVQGRWTDLTQQLYCAFVSISAQALAAPELGALLPGVVAQLPFSMKAAR